MRVGALAPVGGCDPAAPSVRGDLGQPVAGGPAHQRRRGVDARAGAQLPHAGVGLVVDAEGLLADRLQVAGTRPCRRGAAGGGRGRPAPRRARCCRRRRAGSAPAPGCPRAPGPCRGSRAGARGSARAAAPPGRCRTAAGCGRRRSRTTTLVEPAQVVLHRADFGQAVERAHHEEGVAQPAVAVVPVAPAVRRLGDAGGHRGDDRAGVLVQRQLERDGGADHRVLPLQRQAPARGSRCASSRRSPARTPRAVSLDAGGQRLVRRPGRSSSAGPARRGLGQHVARAAHRVLSRSVWSGADIAQVVAALGDRRAGAPPVEARPQQHAHARRARTAP